MKGIERRLSWLLILSLGLVMGADAAKLSRRAKDDLVRQAEVHFKAGRYQESREKWLEVLAGDPTRAEARRWRPYVGRTYEAEGNYQKALTAYQEAYDADPKNVDRLVDLARLYDAVEIDDQALRFYTLAHQRDRGRRDVALALAKLHGQAGHLAEARELAESAVRAEPRDYSAQELLAIIEESQGFLADAARRWETVVSLHPTAEGYMRVGRLWARQDAYEMAAIAFVRAEQAGDTGPAPYFERAVLAARRGDAAAVSPLLEKAQVIGPDYFPVAFWKILLELEAGKDDAARHRLSLLSTTDPATARWKSILEAAVSSRAAGGKP